MGIERGYCPITVITGDNLTARLLADYKPYLKKSVFSDFEHDVHHREIVFGGPVTRIEMLGFRDGSPGYHTKWYWFGGNYDPDYPDVEFSSAMAGVDRFPE